MANVPSLSSVTLSPTVIQVGPAMLHTNVSKPPDTATLLVSGQVSGTNDQRVFGPMLYTVSGQAVGSTVGASNVSHRPQFVDIDIEQALAPVEKVMVREEARLQASMAELTAENLRDTMPGNFFSPVATRKTVDADPLMPAQYRHTITLGGIRVVEPQCVALISGNRRTNQANGPYSYVWCGYKVVFTEGFDLPFSKRDVTVWRVAAECLADIDRTINDQLWQMTCRSNVSS